MRTVRATCLLCDRAVEVAADRVVLHLEGSGREAANRYGFTCPHCSVFVVRPAVPAVIDALLAADVPLSTGARPPWESRDRPGVVLVDRGPRPGELRLPAAPPLSESDVAWFREVLEDDDAIAAWIAAADDA